MRAIINELFRVTDEAGEPVYCFPEQGQKRLGNRFSTGEEGDVRLIGVPVGSLRVRVGRSEKTVEVVAAEETVVEFP